MIEFPEKEVTVPILKSFMFHDYPYLVQEIRNRLDIHVESIEPFSLKPAPDVSLELRHFFRIEDGFTEEDGKALINEIVSAIKENNFKSMYLYVFHAFLHTNFETFEQTARFTVRGFAK